jgi:arginine deiminase
MTNPPLPQAYGGDGWHPRATSLKDELGDLWEPCGLDSEWKPLKRVLLHRPGREMEAVQDDPLNSLMLAPVDPAELQHQHDELARVYRSQGVEVHLVDPPKIPPPNQLFAADLMAMTPEGAILGRPASAVRAGEERWVARALGELGIPILRSVGGRGVFEGADLIWLAPDRALLAQGLRTNGEGATQVAATLEELGVEVVSTQLPPGTMHLMGQLRILDSDLAVGWEGRLPEDAAEAVRKSGLTLHFAPDEEESQRGFALNVVTLGPRKIMMAAGNPVTQTFYEGLGVECVTVEASELGKAAGSIGCLTGVLEREKG